MPSARPALGDEPPEALLPPSKAPLQCEAVSDDEADVVARTLVLASWIPESDDQPVRRRAPCQRPQQLLLDAWGAPSGLAALRGSRLSDERGLSLDLGFWLCREQPWG